MGLIPVWLESYKPECEIFAIVWQMFLKKIYNLTVFSHLFSKHLTFVLIGFVSKDAALYVLHLCSGYDEFKLEQGEGI